MEFLKSKKVITIIIIIAFSVMCLIIEQIVEHYKNGDIITANEVLEEYNEETKLEKADGNDDDRNDSLKNIEDNSINNVLDEKTDDENVNEQNMEDTSVNAEEDKIFVYVTGEVNNSGVVILKQGSRITDAINAAGGTTSKANISKINLVFVLEDGMKLNIPNDNDLKSNPDFEYITVGSGDGIVNSNIMTSSKNNLSESSKNGYSSKIDIVNINTATQTELETLPGIGPSLALKIISYRNENGKFSNIDDIKNVSGIGESKFNDIKNYIVV